MSYKPQLADQTLETVKAQFEAHGIVICDWADAHGFSRLNVYALLGGRLKGRRGEAHRIALALGIKAPVEITESENHAEIS